MKKMITKMGMLAVMASLTMTQAFAGVVEHELEAGDSAVSEFIFVAKTDQTAIIRIAQPGIADALRDGILDESPDNRYGFAFGQPNGGSDPMPWENYVINTVASLNSSLQDEICGSTGDNDLDLEQIMMATGSQDFVTDVSAATLSLDGDCQVTEAAAESTVLATVKVGYEVLVSGGASMDLQLDVVNGIEADLETLDVTMNFSQLVLTQTHYDAAGASAVRDLEDPLGTIVGHGDNGILSFDIGFEATGPSAKPERRASAVFVAAVPL